VTEIFAKLVQLDTIQVKLEGQGHAPKVTVNGENMFLKWSVRSRVRAF